MEYPGPKITHVQIEGLAELSKDEVLEHIALRPSQWLGEKFYYFPGSDIIAQKRIRDLYRAEGYYEAQVAPIRVEISNQDRPVRRQRAKLYISIKPGPKTTIREIQWEPRSSEPTPPKPSDPSLLERSELAVGQRFSISRFNRAKTSLLEGMHEQGYPDAKVQESAMVDKAARRADLRFGLKYGPQVTISAVSVKGLTGYPQRYVQTLASRSIGQPYSPSLLQGIESAVYQLGFISSVFTSLESTSSPQARRLQLKLVQRDPTQLALGATAHFDSTIWSQRLGVRYSHANLFNRLVRLKLHAYGGWAEMPVSDGKWHSSPIVELDAHLSKPSLRFKNLRWFTQLRTLTQPREGYEFWQIMGKIGATQTLGRHASLTLSYNASYLGIYTFASNRAGTTAQINALEGNRPFLSFVEAQAQAFNLDKRVAPKQGIHGLLTYQWASRALASQSEYHRIVPELRGYLHPISWLVVAARSRVGFILPFGKYPGARIDQRFYLGGVGTIRGWPLRSLSPFLNICPPGQACRKIPIGGQSEFLSNLEFRFNVWGDLDVVAFADVGDVQPQVFTIRPKDWMFTAGPGLRYVTPIGAIRLDVGFQLNRERIRFRETRGFAVHLALGDAF